MWTKLNIKRTADWAAQGGFVGVGVSGKTEEKPLWTDEQLGLVGRQLDTEAVAAIGEMEVERATAVAAAA